MTAAFLLPLSGAVFDQEWDLDGIKKDKGRISRITERFKQGDVVHVFEKGRGKVLRTYPEAKSRKKVECRMSYRKDGKLEKIATFIDGKLICTEIGIYDEDGLLRGIRQTDAKNKEMLATTMLVYDEKSRRLKMYGIQTHSGILDYYLEYDKNGNMISIKIYVGNKLAGAARYEHDKNGFITEVVRLNSRLQNTGTVKYEYLLDGNGNWIEKKTYFMNPKPRRAVLTERVTRRIEYFD